MFWHHTYGIICRNTSVWTHFAWLALFLASIGSTRYLLQRCRKVSRYAVLCGKCRYCLRQNTNQLCPECGEQIASSQSIKVRWIRKYRFWPAILIHFIALTSGFVVLNYLCRWVTPWGYTTGEQIRYFAPDGDRFIHLNSWAGDQDLWQSPVQLLQRGPSKPPMEGLVLILDSESESKPNGTFLGGMTKTQINLNEHVFSSIEDAVVHVHAQGAAAINLSLHHTRDLLNYVRKRATQDGALDEIPEIFDSNGEKWSAWKTDRIMPAFAVSSRQGDQYYLAKELMCHNARGAAYAENIWLGFASTYLLLAILWGFKRYHSVRKRVFACWKRRTQSNR